MKLYKKSVNDKSLLLVGELKDKGIVLDEPSKCIHQVDYQSPDLYELPYYAEDGKVVDRFPDSKELLVEDSKFSFGYYDKKKIVFWEQYLKGL